MGTQIHTPKSHKNSGSTPKEEFLSEEKKDLESLLHTKNRELETAIDKIFASFGLQLPHFSLGEFIEHTWHDNDRLLKRLRGFLEKEHIIEKDVHLSHSEILEYRKNFTQTFDNQHIFLSKQFTPDIQEKYIAKVQSPLPENQKMPPYMKYHFFLEKCFHVYYGKKKKRKDFDPKRWTERVGIRCFEEIDKALLEDLDPTTLSPKDQKKLKTTFFYKTTFPHFCSHAGRSFKRSLGDIDGVIFHRDEDPKGIFLSSEHQVFYTKPEEENLSALNLSNSREESLVALNDFDYLIIYHLYLDSKKFSREELCKKYAPYGVVEKKDNVLCFKRNEKIETIYPGKTTKPERLEDRSLDEEGDSDVLLQKAFSRATEYAKKLLLITFS